VDDVDPQLLKYWYVSIATRRIRQSIYEHSRRFRSDIRDILLICDAFDEEFGAVCLVKEMGALFSER
jgi:hypothetical protein